MQPDSVPPASPGGAGWAIGSADRPSIRNLDPVKVAELAESIKREGMLNPIIVTKEPSGALTLIAGNHRLAAMQKVWAEAEDPDSYNMPIREVVCIPKYREVIEISENLNRNDLSAGERNTLAARYLELAGNLGLSTNGTKPQDGTKPSNGTKPKGGRPDTWFSDWYAKTGIPKQSANRLWSQFCADTGRAMTPSEAEKLDQMAFANWIKATEAKKAEDAEAKKNRGSRSGWRALVARLRGGKQNGPHLCDPFGPPAEFPKSFRLGIHVSDCFG